MSEETVWKRITRLFRSGPVVRHKIAGGEKIQEPRGTAKAFKKELSSLYVRSLASYANYERLSRYSDYCFGPETVIYTTQGPFSIKELSERYALGERFNVYSYDSSSKQVVIADAHSARLKEEGAECAMVRVTVDDGGHIDLTPDHQVMLRDGSKRSAGELVPGDSMMPFYRKDLTGVGYRWIYTTNSKVGYGGWQSEHRMVAEHTAGRVLLDNEVVHHVDFQRGNNVPSNLQIMDAHKHKAFHAKLNNKHKKGKPNQKHSDWMRAGGSRRREDINFPAIIRAAIATDYDLGAVTRILKTDRTTVKLRIRERGFTNWKHLVSRRSDIERGITLEVIRRESSTTMQQILDSHPGCSTMYELSCKVGCTEKSITRRLIGNGFEGWTDFKQKFDPTFDRKALYSYSVKKTPIINHRVVSVEPIAPSQVYNITVEEFHNLAAGSIVQTEKESDHLSCCFYYQSEMEFTPELHTAADIYADEATVKSDEGNVIEVTSQNAEIKDVLETLFFDVVDINFNAWSWMRHLCKFGDFVTFVDADEEHGIMNLVPIPINEIEREEGYDPNDPMAVRFRWLTRGNTILENWQIIHFRLLGNDAYLPYGTSIFEAARRIWRQLILIEDAMLVYRIVRSPERRVFHIEIANTPPEQVDALMEQVRTQLKRNTIVDSSTGRVDLRYNPLCNSLKSLIKLMDGRTISLESLIKEWESGRQDQWVYSIDVEGQRMVPGKVIWAGVTRKDAELVRVHFDDGEWIDTTPDHKFMLRDGAYCRADELIEGASLMPLYSTLTSIADGHKIVGYEKVYDPFTQEYVTTHRNNVIAMHGIEALKGEKIVHHKDFDKRNNNPENLIPMTWGDHHALHGREAAIYNQSDIGRANSRRRMKKTWAEGGISPETFVRLWADGDIRKKRVDALTLCVDEGFLEHCFRVMDAISRGLSTKETEFRDALNADEAFQQYLIGLNAEFKNGFNDHLTRGQLQKLLKQAGLSNAFTEFKRRWLASRTDISHVLDFCESHACEVSRKDVLDKFSMTKSDFREIVELAGWSYDKFIEAYVRKSLRYRPKKVGKLNHKVARVERLVEHEDTGCITVDKFHNFASSNENGRSFVYIKNSVEEDYFLPKRGEQKSEISTLAGGQFPVRRDTPIPLLDGRTITIEQLALEYDAGKENWVHSVQDRTGAFVPGKVVWCGRNYTCDRIHRVWLDDDTYADMAPEHPIVMRDGTSKRADAIMPGESVMPFRTKLKLLGHSEYEMVQDPSDDEWKFVHRAVAGLHGISEARLRSGESGCVIHHIDFNRLNNRPDNLRWMGRAEHIRLHGANARLNLHTPEMLHKNGGRFTEMNRSEYGRMATSRRNTVRWDDSEFREMHSGKNHWNVRKWATVYETLPPSGLAKFCLDRGIATFKALLECPERPLVTDEQVRAYLRYHGISSWTKFAKSYLSVPPVNHKVLRVDVLEGVSDEVFCMTVLGPNGEHDRHNFALLCRSIDGNINHRNGVFVNNTGDIEDVQYIQSKMFAAIKIPRAYLGYEENLGCLTISTDCETLDGVRRNMGQMLKAYETGENLWVYSCDQLGRMIPRRVKKVWITRTTSELFRITTDDGNVVECTGNHPFMLRDGTYRQAEQLSTGDSLMPMYRRISSRENGDSLTGYEMCLNQSNQIWEYTHRIVAERSDITRDSNMNDLLEGFPVIHHIDFDKLNNSPSNLREMRRKSHALLHDPSKTRCGRSNKEAARLRALPLSPTNHKVLSVERILLDAPVSVYDLEVDGPENNFAVEKSVMIHNSKATLAQEDVRFSKTIERIQGLFVSELNKIAIIHLFLIGYQGTDLVNFNITMANPSTIAAQQRLELWRMKLEVAGMAQEGIFDRGFVYRKIFGLNDKQIAAIKDGKRIDKLEDTLLMSIENPPEAVPNDQPAGAEPAAGAEELPDTLGGPEPVTAAASAGPEPGSAPPSPEVSGRRRAGSVISERHNPGSTGNRSEIAVDKGKNLFSTGENQFRVSFGTEKQTASDPHDRRAARRLVTRPFSEQSDEQESFGMPGMEQVDEVEKMLEQYAESLSPRDES